MDGGAGYTLYSRLDGGSISISQSTDGRNGNSGNTTAVANSSGCDGNSPDGIMDITFEPEVPEIVSVTYLITN